MILMSLFPGQDRDKRCRTQTVDMAGEREGGTIRESSPDICARPCVRQGAGWRLLCSTGSSARRSVMIWRVGMGASGGD